MPEKLTLWPHQVETFNFFKDREYGLDKSVPGSGKSPVHAKLAEYRLEQQGASRVLILAPISLLYAAWSTDLRRFTPNLTYHVADAPAANRDKAFENPSDIVLLNIDGVKYLAQKGKRYIRKWFGPSPALIIDESSHYRNASSQRTKAILSIAELFAFRTILNGTLFRRSVTEVWSQFKILDGGKALGKTFYPFRNIVQTPVIKGGFTQWMDKPSANAVLYARIAPHTIGHGYDRMKHLPEMLHRVVTYELSDKHRKIYDEFRKKEILDLGNQRISAIHAGAKATKLLQIASGASYTDDDGSGDQKWALIDSGRYELIADLVAEREHTLCFFMWTHQRVELERCFKKRKISYEIMTGSAERRGQIQDRFNAGEFQALLLHPQTGSFGLTLTRGRTVIFSSPIYDALLFVQGTARVRRGLQDKVTESITLVSPRTHDETAYKVFTGDKQNIDVFDSLIHGY